jgi:hypothetical protein
LIKFFQISFIRNVLGASLVLAENGGSFFFPGVPGSRWDDVDLMKLDLIDSSNFEVVQMAPG